MAAVSGRCPNCGTPLRLRIDRRAALEFECPDCQAGLVFVDDPDEPFRKRLLDPAAAAPKELPVATAPSVAVTIGQNLLPRSRQVVRRAVDFLHSPFVLACVAAGLLVLVMVGVVVRQEWERHAERARLAALAAQESAAPVGTISPVSNDPEVEAPAEKPTGQIASVAPPVVPEIPATVVESDVDLGSPVDALVPENAPDGLPVRDPIRDRLEQRLLAYRQPAGVPLERQLFFLEELVGVPIEYEDAIRPLLDRETELALEETTVADVLTALLLPMDLTWRVERDRIVVEGGLAESPRTGERPEPLPRN
jgi:hypothetical protein